MPGNLCVSVFRINTDFKSIICRQYNKSGKLIIFVENRKTLSSCHKISETLNKLVANKIKH